jgi:HlyD family secretion protein
MKRFVILLLVVVVVAGAGYGAYAMGYLPAELTQVIASSSGAPVEAPAAAGAEAAGEVAAEAVESQSDLMQPRVLADAKVIPVRRSDLNMAATGIVQAVAIQEGDRVEAGQLLVKLDDAQQRVAVAQAEANLARAQANLDRIVAGARSEDVAIAEAVLDAAQAAYERVVNAAAPGNIKAAEAALAKAQAEYARVSQGPTDEAIITVRANLASAEAQLNQARSAYNRIKDMSDAGMRPESLAMQQATIALEAAQARYDDLLNGATQADLASASASIRQAQAQLEMMQNSMPSDVTAAAAQVAQAQAQLDAIKAGARSEEIAAAEADVAAATASLQQALVSLRNTELRAPFTGVVATLNANVGEQISPSLPVVQLADDTTWEIRTSDLTELDVVGITEGKRVVLTFDALPDLQLNGAVDRVRPIGQDNRGDTVYTVVVTPDRQDARLLWNMTAVVDFGVK